ncbi:hypothetical protein ACEXQB_004735 [Herbiconiux sp. P18]|uniref:hypothetical protein n=1 Tax=Herbiconiux liangxiaofengii TaxID=3342795 RepID=UPI0035B89A95
MPARTWALSGVLLAGLVLLTMSGCSPTGDETLFTKSPTPSAAPASAAPAPEVPEAAPTVAAPTEIAVPTGLALVVVLPGAGTAGADQADAARDALTVFASANAASVTLLDVGQTTDANVVYQRALDSDPDVVVTVGPAGLDGLQKVAADHPEREFLVLGAKPNAPTANITAVVWPGSDASPVAADLAARVPSAVAAGISEITAARTGLVIALP